MTLVKQKLKFGISFLKFLNYKITDMYRWRSFDDSWEIETVAVATVTMVYSPLSVIPCKNQAVGET